MCFEVGHHMPETYHALTAKLTNNGYFQEMTGGKLYMNYFSFLFGTRPVPYF